jgi:hypothetical protein
VLSTLLGKLTLDPSSADFVAPPPGCASMSSNQPMRTRLLRELPTLDNIGIAVWQKGDESQDVQIPRTDTAGGQGGGDTTTAPSKGKGKAVRAITNDNEVSSDDDAPLQRWLRSIRSTGSTAGGPPPTGPRDPEVVVVPCVDPSGAALLATVPGGGVQ